MITRQDAIRIASELNFPEPLQRLARGETLEARLNTYWGNAEEFFLSAAKAQEPIWDEKIIAMWDNGNFDKVYGVHLPTKKFVEFYIEEDIDPDNLRLWNFQQILLPTFYAIYETFIDTDEEKCERELTFQAELFEFKYVAELLKIGKKNWEDYEELERELSELRETIK